MRVYAKKFSNAIVPALQIAHIHNGVLPDTMNIATKEPTTHDALRMTNSFQGFTGAVWHAPTSKLAKTRRQRSNYEFFEALHI